MPPVQIGPLPASSARAWLGSAVETIGLLSSTPELGVPPEIVAAFNGYLEQWRAAAEQDPFVWTGDVDPAQARELGAYWFHVAALAREASAASGIKLPPPEAEPFFHALVEAIAHASSVADVDHFTEKFEEVVPPFSPPPVPAEPRSPTAPETPPPISLVLVDDTADIRTLLRFTFQLDPRFRVVGEAADGQEAIEVCVAACPNIVLLDITMPVMDGMSALPEIVARCPDSKVVIFSAHFDGVVCDEAMAKGATAVLSKSISMRELAAELLRVV